MIEDWPLVFYRVIVRTCPRLSRRYLPIYIVLQPHPRTRASCVKSCERIDTASPRWTRKSWKNETKEEDDAQVCSHFNLDTSFSSAFPRSRSCGTFLQATRKAFHHGAFAIVDEITIIEYGREFKIKSAKTTRFWNPRGGSLVEFPFLRDSCVNVFFFNVYIKI